MRLQSVTLHNVKGQTGTFPLAPVTLITGTNDQGKTAIAEAVRLALIGYIPRLGKTPAATMKMASDPRSMAVSASWADGKVTALRFRRTGDSVARTVEGESFGPPILMDLATWMNTGSAKDRADYVFSKVGLDPKTFDFAEFRKVVTGIEGPKTDTAQAARREIEALLKKAQGSAKAGKSVPECIEEIVAGLADLTSKATAEGKRLQAALDQATLTHATPPIPEGLSEAEAERQEQAAFAAEVDLRTKAAARTRAAERLAELETGLTASIDQMETGDIEAVVKASEAEIAKLQANLAAVPAGPDPEAEEKDQALAISLRNISAATTGLERRLETTVLPESAEDIDRAEETAKTAQGIAQETIFQIRTALRITAEGEDTRKTVAGQIETKRADIQKEREFWQAYRVETGKIETAMEGLRGRELEIEKATRMVLRHEKCPTCESPGATWHQDFEAAQRLIIDGLQEEQKTKGQELAAKKTAAAASQTAIENLTNELVALEKAGIELSQAFGRTLTYSQELANIPERRKRLTLALEARAGLERELADKAALAATVRERRAELETSLIAGREANTTRDRLARELEDERQELGRYRRQLETRRKMIADVEAARWNLNTHQEVPAEDLATAQKALEDARGNLANARARERARRSAREKEAELAAMRESIAQQEGVLAWLKATGKAAAEGRQILIDKAIGPLVAIARRFTDGLVKWTLAYRDGEFGYALANGVWASTETFSGREERVAFAGIQIALASGHPHKIVVVDELGTMLAENAVAFVQRMQALADGTIDQFIGLCPSAPWAQGMAGQIGLITL